MKTANSPLKLTRKAITILPALFTLIAVSHLSAQSSTNTLATNSPAAAPKLTSEQRREFALLQQAVMGDAEYAAAVKRAIEAQRAVDNLFFTKMAKAAKPELQPYIKFLKEARSSGSSTAP